MEKINIVPHNHRVTAADRSKKKKHRPLVLWFTGLSGSGKSTIADRLEQKLFEADVHTYLLDGDNVRMGLNRGLGFSREDRIENLRRIAEVSKLFLDAGLVVLSAFVSPLRGDRELVRSIVGEENFVEIFVNTSLEECERRDVKGLYKKARAGEISNFTGITAPYEIPDRPAMTIETEKCGVEEAAQLIFDYLFQHVNLYP